MLSDVAADGVFEVGDRFEDAASDLPAGDGREEAFDGIEPGCGSRGEMEDPARVIGEPLFDLGMFVGGVVVGDGMDNPAGPDRTLDGAEELDELLVGVARHAAADDRPVEDVEAGEQGGGAVALIIMGHGAAFAGFHRQAGLGAVERLDLRFLVDRDDDGMNGRVHVVANDIFDLFSKSRVGGGLEGADPVRLKMVCLPERVSGILCKGEP